MTEHVDFSFAPGEVIGQKRKEQKEQLRTRIEEGWKSAQSEGFISADESIPAEQRVAIPDELRGISDDEVIATARKTWPGVMYQIRKAGETLTATEWGSFLLPTWGQDKDDPSKARKYPLAFLPTRGCKHMLEQGGCLVCNYGENRQITEEQIMVEAEKMIEAIERSNDGYKEALFNLNASGSFFDESEIPRAVRSYLLNRLAEYKKRNPEKKVKFLTESRLEFMTEENLKELRQLLGDDIEIEIGYGLENSNRVINEAAMNKRLPDDFEERIALMRKYNVEVVNHILIKPIGVTDTEAIESAVQSIRDSYEKKWADLVIAMTINVRPSTLIEAEHEHGIYEMPNIWAVVKIMKEIGFDLARRSKFLGFSISETAYLGGAKTVTGKTKQEQKAAEIISGFNGKQEDYDNLMSLTSNKEYMKWERTLSKEAGSTLNERLAAHMKLMRHIYLPEAN
jgi:radical SAM enzyme (TIGR01210 family)